MSSDPDEKARLTDQTECAVADTMDESVGNEFVSVSTLTCAGEVLENKMDPSPQKRNGSEATEEGKSRKKLRPDGSAAIMEGEYSNLLTTTRARVNSDDVYKSEEQLVEEDVDEQGRGSHMAWSQEKNAVRREYNRVNAARTRQRNKDIAEARDKQITALTTQVEQLTQMNEMLMKYVCDLQAALKKQSGSTSDANTPNTPLASVPIVSGTSAFPVAKLRHADAHHQNWEQQRAPLDRLASVHNTTSMLQNMPHILNNILRGQDRMMDSVRESVPVMPAQQNLVKAADTVAPFSHSWNGISTAQPPLPQQQTNSLWDLLLLMDQFRSTLTQPDTPR
jgi:hypothetical protein